MDVVLVVLVVLPPLGWPPTPTLLAGEYMLLSRNDISDCDIAAAAAAALVFVVAAAVGGCEGGGVL